MAAVRNKKTTISFSTREIDLITAAGIYKGAKMPNNLDVSAYLKGGSRLPVSWILGTGTIYEDPGKEFGGEVRSGGLAFQVPKKYRGLKDTALLFQSGFCIDRRTGLYTGKVTHVVEEFPASNGWYCVDDQIGIPQGRETLDDNAGSVYLHRRNCSNYIGAVARGTDFPAAGGRGMYMYARHYDDGLRVAIFGKAMNGQAGHDLRINGYDEVQFRVLLRRAAAAQSLPQTSADAKTEPITTLLRALLQSR